MDTLKQTAVTVLLNLPDFTEIDDMIAVLRRLQFHRELAELPTSPPSFLEVAKKYIGSLRCLPHLGDTTVGESALTFCQSFRASHPSWEI